MLIRLTNMQARLYGEKLLELGNLALIGLGLTPLLPGQIFSVRVVGLGVVAFVALYILAYYLTKGGDE